MRPQDRLALWGVPIPALGTLLPSYVRKGPLSFSVGQSLTHLPSLS